MLLPQPPQPLPTFLTFLLLEVDRVGLADTAESSGVDVAVRQTALTTVLLVRARHTAHSLGTLGHTPGKRQSYFNSAEVTLIPIQVILLLTEVTLVPVKVQDKVPCSEIRRKQKTTDVIEYTLKQKRTSVGHIAQMKDNRWTKFYRR